MTTDRYELARTIIGLLEDELAAAGFELLDVRIFRGGGRQQVRIYVDVPGGVDLDGCARASRTADMLLEEADVISERYVIEVSSPGVRRPLRTPGHFAAQVGERLEIRLAGDEPGRSRRVRLVAADDQGVTLAPLGEGPASAEEEDGEDAGPAAPPAEAPHDGDAREAAAPETVPYARILEANLEPDFDAAALIRADRRQKKDQRRRARRERAAPKRRRRPKS